MIISRKNLGFMQGRLSPIIDNMIQRFPKDNWEKEIILAKKYDWNLMEWTIDYFSFPDNPILHDNFKQIDFLGIQINTITADFFMQRPFFMSMNLDERKFLISDLKKVINSMIRLKIKYLVLPLVDNASLIKNKVNEDFVIDSLTSIFDEFSNHDIEFIFESDYEPQKLLNFIQKFNSQKVGINYDSGNSASLGFDSEDEILTYGQWIKNCHLKDRVLGGTTVNFGDGNANFSKVLKCLSEIGYNGNFIIQGARAEKGDHLKTLNYYRNYILEIFQDGL